MSCLAAEQEQGRLVGRLYEPSFVDRITGRIDLRLTARTGIAFALVGYYSLTVNGAFVTVNPTALLATVGNFIIGIACFVLPLLGIQARLVSRKAGMVDAANQRLKLAMADLYDRLVLRGFVTALVLPVIVFSATSEIGKVLGP